MKRLLIIAMLALMTMPVWAQSNDKKPGLHKENCTFVNKDGKDVLVGTNREIDEVALYTITE